MYIMGCVYMTGVGCIVWCTIWVVGGMGGDNMGGDDMGVGLLCVMGMKIVEN